jgi:hypothetical protein
MVLDREQLDALKRQIEEEYRLDMAAIERLQRRFMHSGTSSSSSSSNGRSLASAATASPSYLVPGPDSQAAASPVLELPQERQPDELTGTLRAMFSTKIR